MRGLTPDQVEQALLHEEAVIAAARARQLRYLALADAMQLPTADGCKSLKEWAAGRLDLAPENAYRLTAMTRRMADAPELYAQLAEGEIGFDRAEALSRIPPAARVDQLRGLDIKGLQRIAARHRRMTRSDDHAAHAASQVAMQPNLDESRWRLWADLDGYAGHVVNKHLTERADEIPALPDGTRPGLGYRMAAALTATCEDASTASGSGTPNITLFVDDHGIEVEAGTTVGPEILDKVACAGALELIKTVDGIPLAIGRRRRVIPNRLRRFVLHRDGGCTADGCPSTYRLQVHHIIPWSEGGPTDPENLTTLCWFHHHVVVHGFGYRIDPTLGPGRIRFIAPVPPGRAPPGEP